MNKYKITTFSFGQAQSFIIEAYDIFSALSAGAVNDNTAIISIELVGTSNIVDLTE